MHAFSAEFLVFDASGNSLKFLSAGKKSLIKSRSGTRELEPDILITIILHHMASPLERRKELYRLPRALGTIELGHGIALAVRCVPVRPYVYISEPLPPI